MKIRHRLAGVGLMVSILGCTFPAWAGEWIQGENGQWVYEENQELLKGWNRIDGIRFQLDMRISRMCSTGSIHMR